MLLALLSMKKSPVQRMKKKELPLRGGEGRAGCARRRWFSVILQALKAASRPPSAAFRFKQKAPVSLRPLKRPYSLAARRAGSLP